MLVFSQSYRSANMVAAATFGSRLVQRLVAFSRVVWLPRPIGDSGGG